MKKYYPVDFDEKGNAVLGTPKNTPTSNGFIPTTWAPGGGSGDGNGIKSITISPAITTTPALESLFPIYYEDLTDEQKEEHMVRMSASTPATLEVGDTYTATITPTSDMYLLGDNGFGGKGEPVTLTCEVVDIDGTTVEVETSAINQIPPSADAMFFDVDLSVTHGGK